MVVWNLIKMTLFLKSTVLPWLEASAEQTRNEGGGHVTNTKAPPTPSGIYTAPLWSEV